TALELGHLIAGADLDVGAGLLGPRGEALEHLLARAGLERNRNFLSQAQSGRLVHDVLALLILDDGRREISALEQDVRHSSGRSLRARSEATGPRAHDHN